MAAKRRGRPTGYRNRRVGRPRKPLQVAEGQVKISWRTKVV